MSKILSFFMLIFFTSTATFGNDLDSSEKSIIEQDLSIGNSLSLESESMVEADNSNRYGFIALWKQSDWVAKGALVVLLIMSLGSWTIFVSKFFEQSKVIKECTMLKESYERGIIVSQIFKDLPKSCLLNIVYNAGKEAKLQTNTSDNSIDPANWVGEGIQSGINQVNGYLQNGLTFLATVGSTAPFVGLFGTVWAIYHALIKIGDSGQATGTHLHFEFWQGLTRTDPVKVKLPSAKAINSNQLDEFRDLLTLSLKSLDEYNLLVNE